jgi:hypothetical protein
MDKESAQLLRIVLIGFVIIIAFLLWVGLTEAQADLQGPANRGALAALGVMLG